MSVGDSDLRIRPGRIRSTRVPKPKSFISQVLRAAKKAGHTSSRTAAGRRSMAYGRSTFGRGRLAFSRSRLFSPTRRVVVKARAFGNKAGPISGVIHAGVYYQPGGLKARFCKEGVEATIRFCREHGLLFEQCGKLLVATDAAELDRMTALHQRCIANGLPVEKLDGAELRRREPHIHGVGALFMPTTGVVDYGS